MMITYALIPLISSEHIDRICIVADKKWRADILEDVKEAGIDAAKIAGFADPGETRQLSILCGIKAILGSMDRTVAIDEKGDEDTVFIHDAARPFLTENMIDDCYDALPGHDGVMPALAMKDTMYLSRDGRAVSELLDRNEIYAGQAPELFRMSPYYWANMKLMPDKIKEINGATEPAVMDGLDIVMIQGDERNFKVTTDEDLKRFIRNMNGEINEDI